MTRPIRADSRSATATETVAMKADIMALPGLKQFINVIGEDGKGYVISVVESKEASDGNMERVKALWGRMGPHLAAMPVPEGGDVVADWSN